MRMLISLTEMTTLSTNLASQALQFTDTEANRKRISVSFHRSYLSFQKYRTENVDGSAPVIDLSQKLTSSTKWNIHLKK